MTIIRNAKQQINSFEQDVDIINTKLLNWQEAYADCQWEVQMNREREQEKKEINLILKSILDELENEKKEYVEVVQYARRIEPLRGKKSKGINRPFTHLKTIVNR